MRSDSCASHHRDGLRRLAKCRSGVRPITGGSGHRNSKKPEDLVTSTFQSQHYVFSINTCTPTENSQTDSQNRTLYRLTKEELGLIAYALLILISLIYIV